MLTQQERRAANSIEEAIALEDWPEARRLIREQIKRKPNDHWLFTRLGVTYYEDRQYRKALQYTLEALQIQPYCPLVIWDYAGTLDMLERRKEALQLYRWLISWGEDALAYGECGEGIQRARSLMADCFYRIARVYEDTGQRKKGIAAYREHLRRRTTSTRSIYPLKTVRKRLARLEEAA